MKLFYTSVAMLNGIILAMIRVRYCSAMCCKQRQVSYGLILHVEDYSVIMHEESGAERPRLDVEVEPGSKIRSADKRLK